MGRSRRTFKVRNSGLFAFSLFRLFAYSPTLQFDYVTQDQWRTFRYSTQERAAYDHVKLVEKLFGNFMPDWEALGWMTKCVGYAAVAKILDFIYLRPIVLVSAIYLGAILAIVALAASAFLMVPEYFFTYLLTMPALIVLVFIILAGTSKRA